MEVKTAFLNGLLDEDIDMVQPDGYTDEERPDYVCHLKRSVYGLKQSPRLWNQTIDKFMLELGCKKCEADHCIYATWNDQDMIFVALYVDDLVLASNNDELLKSTKEALSARFDMTDLGHLNYFLGMEIEQESVCWKSYSDADWAGDVEIRRSTSGYAFMMNGGCISWRSKMQRTVALSSTEAEYMALTEATQEAICLKAFLCELCEMKSDKAVKIYEDNQGSIALAKNPEFYKRTKHIYIRYHFVREKVEDGQVVLQYCSTKGMKVDLMTKPITAVQFESLRSKLGIQAPSTPSRVSVLSRKRLVQLWYTSKPVTHDLHSRCL
ncbi:unnamed protein product [Phytophthora lilii]|uniref:Unnamed protein product n=1 Tax=Phytophthora lilii TaxID=2077276 RepID=A0A9W6XBT1_9STRA|nr:unnamed protein product [Phytophthora lilii]